MSPERNPPQSQRRGEDQDRGAPKSAGRAGAVEKERRPKSTVERDDWRGEGVCGDQHTD
jgi:hypothetical protein